jgi:DNA topoisomerase-6 subunit A
MAAIDKRHKETIGKIKLIMKDICKDVLSEKKMPSLDITKIGYDNTVWSEEKRMLTIGTKTVHIVLIPPKKSQPFHNTL